MLHEEIVKLLLETQAASRDAHEIDLAIREYEGDPEGLVLLCGRLVAVHERFHICLRSLRSSFLLGAGLEGEDRT